MLRRHKIGRHHLFDGPWLKVEFSETRQDSARHVICLEKIKLAGSERWVWQQLEQAGLHFGDKADPDTVDRTVSANDEERVRAWVRRRMPLANGERRDAKVCMYTNTPDAHFIVDRLPDHPNVLVASACSGHGFKFSTVIGEILADLVLEGETRHPIGFLSADRLVRG